MNLTDEVSNSNLGGSLAAQTQLDLLRSTFEELVSCPVNSLNHSLRLFASVGVAAPRHSPAMTRRRALPAAKIRYRMIQRIHRTGH